MEELFEMIAKALAWQHFGVDLGDGYASTASLFRNDGEGLFEQMLSAGNVHVSGDVVDQTGDRRPIRASVHALVSGTSFRFLPPDFRCASNLVASRFGRL